MVVLLQAPTASLKYFFGRLCRFLGKDLRNHDRISVDAIYHSPVARHVIDSQLDRKSTRLNSSHSQISYAVFCLKKKTTGNDALELLRKSPGVTVDKDDNISLS